MPHEFHIYVIELEYEAHDCPKVSRVNPCCNRKKPPLYVGLTGLDVSERYRQHMVGYKSNKFVHKYGWRLRPGLAPRKGFDYQQALTMEVRTAWALRDKGYAVIGAA